MLQRPPLSTLFPYRRSSDLVRAAVRGRRAAPPRATARSPGTSRVDGSSLPPPLIYIATVRISRDHFLPPRSEEHTSELQSHSDLVCRLLLEKKKKTNIHTYS